MHTVCETFAFQAAAKEAGMSRDEVEDLTLVIAADPEAGDMMKDTGGCRKLRFAKPGGGKSGGYRIITYFGGENLPVFLLTVFGKGDKANLTQREKQLLASLTKTLADTYRKKVVNMGSAR